MNKKCSYADKYKAVYPPKCGCVACSEKYSKKQDAQEKDFLDEIIDERTKKNSSFPELVNEKVRNRKWKK